MEPRLNLVTGGTGFVGKYLVRALSAAGERVRVLARSAALPSELAGLSGVEHWRGDVTRAQTLAGALDGVSRVYHLAARGHVAAVSPAAEAEFMRVNVDGTQNVLQACAGRGVSKFLHFSSTAAMGLIRKPQIAEKDSPEPVTPYQRSKLASERLALELGRKLEIPTVVLRPCMIYGVGGKGEFHKFAQLMRWGLFPRVGLGRNLTPLVHVRDVVKGARLAAGRGRPGEVYLLASAASIPLEDLRRQVLRAWGVRGIHPFVPTQVMLGLAHAFEIWSALTGARPPATRQNILSTVQGREFSIQKAREELGYEPEVSFADGIAETVLWFKAGCA